MLVAHVVTALCSACCLYATVCIRDSCSTFPRAFTPVFEASRIEGMRTLFQVLVGLVGVRTLDIAAALEQDFVDFIVGSVRVLPKAYYCSSTPGVPSLLVRLSI